MQRPMEWKKEFMFFLFFFLTSDALCTIVYADGVYIAGVCYHCSYELSG
jgi:hypothetical protein